MALRVGVFSLIACGVRARMRGGAGARTLAGCDSAAHSAGKPTPRHTRAHRSLRAATPAPRRPGALLGASITLTLDTTPPGLTATDAGVRTQGSPDKRYTFHYVFAMTCPPRIRYSFAVQYHI